MNRKNILYPGYARQIKNAKKRLLESNGKKENINLFLNFLTKVEADGTSLAQQISYVNRIKPIMELIGNTKWKEVTKKKMEEVFAKYRNGKNYSQSSINKTIENLKAFYRWVFDLSSQDPAPDAVRWLKREKAPNKLRSEDLWTEDDMNKATKVTRSLRDKCILSMLYESGLRPGELRGLRVKDVVINKDMVRLYVAGKTERNGGERVVPLVRSFNIIRTWLSQHPNREDRNAWFWTFNGTPLRDATLRAMFAEIGRKAGIEKPLNPYILRHTALTKFYKSMSGTTASKIAGHSPGSKQAQTYCHLSVEDLESSVKEMNGIKSKGIDEERINCHKAVKRLLLGTGFVLCVVLHKMKKQLQEELKLLKKLLMLEQVSRHWGRNILNLVS